MANHAVEYAVLDRAGRLQLPREMTEPLGMHDLVRLEGEPDHIGVWPEARHADKLADRPADGSASGPAERETE
jgi:DNA-binding transcriptional regulator/RsmH inhibitor MraZ